MSIAREYSPKGVHTAHVIVDGVIDTELHSEMDQGYVCGGDDRSYLVISLRAIGVCIRRVRGVLLR